MFGAIMVWEVWRYFDGGWIRRYYVEPEFHFKYFGFEWVQAWPGNGMYLHFLLVGIFAAGVCFGFLYRLNALLLFLGFTYWYLLDQTNYLNHFYLTALIAFFMVIIPAHRAKSVDARIWPEIRSQTVPAWYLWLMRAQLGIVYFYAGIAKLNSDWLQGEPIREWIANRRHYPIIGPFFDSEPGVWLFAYGGLIFDLLVVPALLWPKTRWWAFAACVMFHVTNKALFNIGIFPPMMLAATLLFFPPDWPRKVPLFFAPLKEKLSTVTPAIPRWRRNTVVIFLVVYLGLQLLIPFRHLLYPGWVHWNEEGHRFSWRMKLRDKSARAEFTVTIPSTGEVIEIDNRDWLSSRQSGRFGRCPDMVLQFAHLLRDDFRRRGHGEVEVRVKSSVSLNGRERQPMIDPLVDLAKEPRTLGHVDWILPLEKPLVIYQRTPRSEDRTRY